MGVGLGMTLLATVGQIVLFMILMLVVGRRFFPWLLWQVAKTGSHELFTLCVIAAAVGIAYAASAIFGVSFALGAFIAGMVLRESELAYRAAEESLPLRDAFAVLFFVSVGMLFQPMVLLESPMHLLLTVLVIIFGKSLAAFILVLAFRYPLNTALTVSASLAQIGEFSFILASLGVALGVVPLEAHSLILASAILSIGLNPLVFKAIEPAQVWIRSRSLWARKFEHRDDPLAELPATVGSHEVTGHVVLVGYGRVGRRIGEALIENKIGFVVAEQNREVVERLRERGIHAVVGDAAEPAVLIQAHIARARILVIATPDTFNVRQMIETARLVNPHIETIVRTHSEDEAILLTKENAGKVFLSDHELAHGMLSYVIDRVNARQAMNPGLTEL
jgi:monovalent cation:H+ antiporter-2, CPA2 family